MAVLIGRSRSRDDKRRARRAERGRTRNPNAAATPGDSAVRKLPDTSIAEDISGDLADGEDRDLSFFIGGEGRKDVFGGDGGGLGVCELVGDAGAAEGGGAGALGVGVDGEDGACAVAVVSGLDVLEDVAFDEDVCTGFCDVKGVACVVGPVVREDVPEAGGADFGGSAGGLVNVVVCKGDFVVLAEGKAFAIRQWLFRLCPGSLHSPVVVTVARGRPVSGAVKLVVGDGNASTFIAVSL